MLIWIQAFDTKRPVASPSHLYPVCVLLFQLHGGMVGHMQASSTVHNTKYLDPYHWNYISFSCLFLRQWYRDVALGTDRHLDISFGLQVVESSSLVSILFREVFSRPYISFFYLLVNGFCVTTTSFCTFLRTPYHPYIGGRYRWAGRN